MFTGDLGPIFLNNKLLFSGYRYEDNSDGYTAEDRELFVYDPQNITLEKVIKFTFDFKLQVLEQLYPIFPSEDSADLAIDEPMVNITFQHKTSTVDILELNQNIMTGHRSSCAILTNGSLACWGNGNFGVLGNGERDNTGEPTITSSMPGNHSVIGVDGSEYLTCALLSNGSVSCWGGINSKGEMGN